MNLKPVTVLRSSQPLLIEEFVEKLKEADSVNSGEVLFEIKHLENFSLQEILEDAFTFPMFHKEKLVVVKGYDELGGKDLELLKKYSAEPSSFSRVVFTSGKKRKAEPKPSKNLAVVDLDEKSSVDGEINRIAEKLGISLTPGAVGLVKSLLGEDMNLIRNELEKVSFYKKDKRVVEGKDIRNLVEKRSEESVFSLSDAISNKDLRGSLRILSELEKNGEDPLSMLYMMARRFRQIFKTSQLLREGRSDQEIAKAIGASRGAVFYIKKSATKFGEDDSGRILGLIERADYEIKNGPADKYIPLGKLLLGICGVKDSGAAGARPVQVGKLLRESRNAP